MSMYVCMCVCNVDLYRININCSILSYSNFLTHYWKETAFNCSSLSLLLKLNIKIISNKPVSLMNRPSVSLHRAEVLLD